MLCSRAISAELNFCFVVSLVRALRLGAQLRSAGAGKLVAQSRPPRLLGVGADKCLAAHTVAAELEKPYSKKSRRRHL